MADSVLANFFFFYGIFLTDTDYAPKLLVSVSTRVVMCRRLYVT